MRSAKSTSAAGPEQLIPTTGFERVESEAEEHKALCFVCLFVLIIYSTRRCLVVDAW